MRYAVKLVNIVEAVQEAKKRVPAQLEPFTPTMITFYSKYDLWMYDAVLDDRLCNRCLAYEAQPRWFGNQLRIEFEYHEIVSKNKINAKVHPNCRCTLTRVVDWTQDDVKWFVSVR